MDNGFFKIRMSKKNIEITKASEARWNYSCDNKVSFDRVQILTSDFSGRRPPLPYPPPPLPSSPLPTPVPLFSSLSSSYFPSLFFLRKFDSVLSSLFGMRLALRILRPHSLTLTFTLLFFYCLIVSLIFFSSFLSLSFFSPLFLSLSLSSLFFVFPFLFSFFSFFFRRRIRVKSHILRKLVKLAGVTLAITRFFLTG